MNVARWPGSSNQMLARKKSAAAPTAIENGETRRQPDRLERAGGKQPVQGTGVETDEVRFHGAKRWRRPRGQAPAWVRRERA